jgi:virginiamycin B lyase
VLLATYTEPGTNKSPEDIVTAPDGALWFTDVNQSAIYRMTTAGAFTKFPISASIGLAGPLVFGPDEKLWFAAGENGVGRLDTVAGTVTAFALVSGGLPFGIALGPDGAFYVTEFGSGQISRLQ